MVHNKPNSPNGTGSNPSTESNIKQQVDRTSYKCYAMHENRNVKGSKGTVPSWTVGRRPLPSPKAAAAAARRAPPPPVFAGKIVSGQFDEENPFVQISSVLLVQSDEGVSFLVVDRIGDFYRNLPKRVDVIVTTVGARHKCQQVERRHFATQSMRVIRFPDVNASQLSCSLQLVLREKLATGFDDVSYATSFELVETQRFNATSGCPVFGI
ncbi:ATP binding protein [Dorcoceras hygrometricum]|uniref:ATP binding protein n=1 Tax=Dorcoceras hygrometricum TaxID=472368 RepID=A0A2Z7ATS1_9LAMI|nr:ATP binding protein [Dorcoceras hygrometricum]